MNQKYERSKLQLAEIANERQDEDVENLRYQLDTLMQEKALFKNEQASYKGEIDHLKQE